MSWCDHAVNTNLAYYQAIIILHDKIRLERYTLQLQVSGKCERPL